MMIERYQEALTCFDRALTIDGNNTMVRENRELALAKV
jgi:hypothetical protein